MSDVVKADIFFFITAVAVVCISVIFAVVLTYLIRILRNIKDVSEDFRHVSGTVRHESDAIARDINELRGSVKKEGVRWKNAAGVIRSWFLYDKGRKPKQKKG